MKLRDRGDQVTCFLQDLTNDVLNNVRILKKGFAELTNGFQCGGHLFVPVLVPVSMIPNTMAKVPCIYIPSVSSSIKEKRILV